MTRAYFDASAIVKLVCQQAESPALREFLDEPIEAVTSAMSAVEVPRSLTRLGFALEEAHAALRGFYVIGLDASILARAATLQPRALRSLDAVHLATALEVGGDGLVVVTYDDRAAAAARALGLVVAQPGR